MTTEQKLDFIRTKCNLANPTLMDLGFGCEIRLKLSGRYGEEIWKRFLTMVWKLDDNKYRFVGERGWIDQGDLMWHKDSFEILGRLPSLADVLNAIHKPVKFYTIVPTVPIDLANLLYRWDLKKPFDQQDKSCIDFLFELLK